MTYHGHTQTHEDNIKPSSASKPVCKEADSTSDDAGKNIDWDCQQIGRGCPKACPQALYHFFVSENKDLPS